MGRTVDEPIRILHVVGGMVRAGIETWLMHMLRHIDRHNFRMDFLVHTAEPCAYDDEATALGARIIPCLNPDRPWTYAAQFRRILREHGPYDVVHSQVFLFSGFVLWLAARAGVPHRIAHMHVATDLKAGGPIRGLYRASMASLIARHATLILAPSESSLRSTKALLGAPAGSLRVMYNCVDLDRFSRPVDVSMVRQRLGLPACVPVITYVARFAPHKNHAQVLRVAERVNGSGYRAHFVMAGSHGETLPQIAGAAARRRDVTVLIGLPDVSELLLASDVFLFPSLNEGFGVVAIEAAAAGLPIVATDLDPIREACPRGHHPFLFPPDDDDRCAAAIERLLADKALRAGLAAQAREWARRFSVHSMIQELQAVYERSDGVIPRCPADAGMPRGGSGHGAVQK